MTSLATFLHISDLHIGEIDAETGDAANEPEVVRQFPLIPTLQGLLGHHYRAANSLCELFALLKAEENAKLIVTGDITRCGSLEEFNTAIELLEGGADFGWRGKHGLGSPDWRARSVPGNHDHWTGQPSLLGRGTTHSEFFPSFPQIGVKIEVHNGVCLRFICLDSDADNDPMATNRALARGAFETQLVEAEQVLDTASKREIRVVVLHHSRAHKGRVLSIRKETRALFDEFIWKHNIQVLLSGHLHTPLVDPIEIEAKGYRWRGFEARCGTSTARTTAPLKWNMRLKSEPNFVLVHRISEDSGNLIWSTFPYLLGPTGFEPLKRDDRGEDLYRDFVVFPCQYDQVVRW